MVKRYDPVGWCAGMDEVASGGYVRIDDYAALQAENERLREKVGVTMGVGSGGGNSFVHGDYDSIKVLQGKLLEVERLRSENERLKAAHVDTLKAMRQAVVALAYAQQNDPIYLQPYGLLDAAIKQAKAVQP